MNVHVNLDSMEMDIRVRLISVRRMVIVVIMHIVYPMNNDQVSANVFVIQVISLTEQLSRLV